MQQPIENAESLHVYDGPIECDTFNGLESAQLPVPLQSNRILQHADLVLANSSLSMQCCMVGDDRAVFFRDFNEANRELETTQWRYLRTLSKKCNNGTYIMWICDCRDGAHRASLLIAINHTKRSVVEGKADADRLWRCHHLDTLDEILRRMPLLTYPQLQEQDQILIHLHKNPLVVSFKHHTDSNRSVVYVCRSGKLRCHSCSFNCDHVRDVKALLNYQQPKNSNQQPIESVDIEDDNGNDDVEPEAEAEPNDSGVRSRERIPLIEQRDRSHSSVPFRLVAHKEHDAKCLCGADWNETSIFSRKSRVYDVKHSTDVEIYEYRCTNIQCQHVLRYDGRHDYLFVYSVDIIFTHDLMRSYDYSLQHRASSFSAFVKQHRSQYAEYKDTFVSKSTWIKAFWAWTKLQLYNFDDAFSCKICAADGYKNTVWVYDATSLSFRKRNSTIHEQYAKLPSDESEPNGRSAPPSCRSFATRIGLIDVVGCSSIEHRLLFRDAKLRGLIRRYAGVVDFKRPMLTKEEGIQLREMLLQIPFMKTIVGWLIDLERNRGESYRQEAPVALQALLRNIAAASPISGFITNPHEMQPLLHKLSLGHPVASHVSDMAMLGDHCPVLAQLLVQRPFASSASFPEAFWPLLRELGTKCYEFYTELDLSEQAAPPDLEPVTEAFDWERGMFFGPHLRFRRPLRQYAADSESANAEESPCYREGQTGRQLLPGLLTMFCQHEVCHGFTVLTAPESERHVFQLTYCRMATGPRITVYDRGCKLHVYSLKREPAFYRLSTFRVDITHSSNHVACSDTYKHSLYRSAVMHASLKNAPYANTQIAEQFNAWLKQIRTPAAFMSQDHFLQFVRVFLARRNMLKKGELI